MYCNEDDLYNLDYLDNGHKLRSLEYIEGCFKDMYDMLYGLKEFDKIKFEGDIENIMYELNLKLCDRNLCVEPKQSKVINF